MDWDGFLSVRASALCGCLMSCAAACSFDVDGFVGGTQAAIELDASDTQEEDAEAGQADAGLDGGSSSAEDAGGDALDAAMHAEASADPLADAQSDAPMMSSARDAGVDAEPLLPVPRFGPPHLYDEVVLDGNAVVSDPTLSGDRLQLYFTQQVGQNNSDIVAYTRSSTTGTFAIAAPLMAINSPVSDVNPELSRDGLELFFASTRNSRSEVFYSRRSTRSGAWSTPVAINFGTTLSVAGAVPTPDGTALVVCLKDELRKWAKSYLSLRQGPTWSEPTRLIIANWPDTTLDTGGMLDERGRLWFASAPNETTAPQLYYADPVGNGTFATPTPFTDVNALAGSKRDPWISPDGREIVFSVGDLTGGASSLAHSVAVP